MKIDHYFSDYYNHWVFDMQAIESGLKLNSIQPSKVEAIPKEHDSFWGSDGFNFGDVLDMVNPLHHLPVVSKYYREHSEDDASEGARLVGGVVFGGLLGGVAGLVTSLANAAVRHETQEDISEQVLEVAEESIEKITSSFSQQFNTNKYENDSNPFFAQMNEDNNHYAPKKQDVSSTRTREWGKV